jgi:hypothetical protein
MCGGSFELDAIVCVRLGYSRLLPSDFVGNLELQQTLIGSHQIRALHPEAIVWQPSYSAHPTPPHHPHSLVYCSYHSRVDQLEPPQQQRQNSAAASVWSDFWANVCIQDKCYA